VDLGFFERGDQVIRKSQLIWKACNPDCVFDATYTDSGPYPSLNTAESSCYCSDASTLAKGLRVQWEGLCGHSNSCSMPLALSFETCTDNPQFHNPQDTYHNTRALGYVGSC